MSRTRLSKQQEEITTLAAAGHTNKEIAARLNVGIRTIETQFRRLRQKLGTGNRAESIARASSLVMGKALQGEIFLPELAVNLLGPGDIEVLTLIATLPSPTDLGELMRRLQTGTHMEAPLHWMDEPARKTYINADPYRLQVGEGQVATGLERSLNKLVTIGLIQHDPQTLEYRLHPGIRGVVISRDNKLTLKPIQVK